MLILSFVCSVKETHQIAAAQEEKNRGLRQAFGISEYFVEGSSLDPNRKVRETAAKQAAEQKTYTIVRTPSPEPKEEAAVADQPEAVDGPSKPKKNKKSKSKKKEDSEESESEKEEQAVEKTAKPPSKSTDSSEIKKSDSKNDDRSRSRAESPKASRRRHDTPSPSRRRSGEESRNRKRRASNEVEKEDVNKSRRKEDERKKVGR